MENIISAVRRAKAFKKPEKPRAKKETDRADDGASIRSRALTPADDVSWSCPVVRLDSEHLERHRVVSYEARDSSHMAFNVLRTKINQSLSANSRKSLAITSPSEGCGKTTVAINLAFSLARQKSCRTVLIDLDLKRSSVAQTLGVSPQKSIGNYLEGSADLEQCFVQASNNLFFGLNIHRSNKVFELAQHQRIDQIIPSVIQALDPTVIIVDLPPLLSNDEVMAFLPRVDTSLLVAAAGKTTAEEIENCQAELNGSESFLGVVLNKCTDVADEYYY